jgi:lipopolysaccharide export system protein LptC
VAFLKNRFLYSLAAISLIAFAGLSLQSDPEVEAGTGTTTIGRNNPDMYGRNIQFNQLHEDGRLHYRLNAQAIEQYDTERLTRMEIPRLHLRSENQPPWDIQSLEGFIRQSTSATDVQEEVVFLTDKVQMLQRHPVNGLVTLRSDSFYLYPDRQYAQTQQNVTIDTQVGRTTAAGMTVDLETGVLTLISSDTQRIHTIVLPQQFKKS